MADETWYVPATVTVALLYINRVDGFWIWPEGDSAALAFKYPAEVGESYDYGGFRMKLTSDNYPVTVSGGTYTCYRYLETHPDIDLDTVVHYYTPGVGLIRRDEIDAVGDSRGRLVVRWSLVDFQLQ